MLSLNQHTEFIVASFLQQDSVAAMRSDSRNIDHRAQEMDVIEKEIGLG
jgi:hypothetical protein